MSHSPLPDQADAEGDAPPLAMPPLLPGRRGLVLGVANPRSLAWAAVEALSAAGAQVAFTYLDERAARRARPLAERAQSPFSAPCDVRDDASLKAAIDGAAAAMGGLDFLVHSVAFAEQQDLAAPLHDCSREGFKLALDVSAYSLVRAVHFALPHLSSGASVVTLTYLGARVAIPLYGLMGPAKAALEAEVRYLARELGPRGVRVNAVSAGPVKTLAAAGLPGFRDRLKETTSRTPLGRGVTHEEVAAAVCFLCSPLSGGITATTLHVDAGEHAVSL